MYSKKRKLEFVFSSFEYHGKTLPLLTSRSGSKGFFIPVWSGVSGGGGLWEVTVLQLIELLVSHAAWTYSTFRTIIVKI